MPIYHEWNGTVLTITSDSGTSSANLIGPTGDDGPRGPAGPAGSATVADSSTLGGRPAEDYALKTDVPSIEGLATETYVNNTIANQPQSAYNLLDNSDFTNPINQRNNASGKTVATNDYIFDRWRAASAGTIEFDKNGYVPKITTNQTIIKNPYVGKTLTAVLWFADGTKVVRSGVVPDTDDWTNIIVSTGNMTITTQNDKLMFRIAINESHTIAHAALYVGEYNDNNCPQYVPKGYAEELYACRRYYRQYDNCFVIGYMHTTTQFSMPIDAWGMTGKPTITNFSPMWLYLSDGGSIDLANIGTPVATSQGRANITIAVENTRRITGSLFAHFGLSCEI